METATETDSQEQDGLMLPVKSTRGGILLDTETRQNPQKSEHSNFYTVNDENSNNEDLFF